MSPPLRLSGIDIQKIGKGAVIALAGSLLAYIGQEVIPALQGTNLGWLAPLGAVLVNLMTKWLTDTR